MPAVWRPRPAAAKLPRPGPRGPSAERGARTNGPRPEGSDGRAEGSRRVDTAQHTDQGVDSRGDEAVGLLDLGHGLLDLTLGRLVALGHRLRDGVARVGHSEGVAS